MKYNSGLVLMTFGNSRPSNPSTPGMRLVQRKPVQGHQMLSMLAAVPGALQVGRKQFRNIPPFELRLRQLGRLNDPRRSASAR